MSLPNMSENAQTEKPLPFGAILFLQRYKAQIIALVTLAFFCLIGLAIIHLTEEVRYQDLVEALNNTPLSAIVLAFFFTIASFMALIFYDVNALDYMGKKLPFIPVALTAFSAYAVGNTAGFGALSAGAIRYRSYSRLGLTPEDIGRIVAFVTLSFGVGLAGLTTLSLLVIADDIGPLIGISAFVLRVIASALAIFLAVVLYAGRGGRLLRFKKLSFRLPDSRTWSRQFLVTAFDIAASASVLYVLLPSSAAINWPSFLAIYAIAIGLGVLSHVPAGIGVFETVIIAALGKSVNVDAVLGSLVLYRLIYHIVPLVIAIILVLITELRRFADHPVASGVRRVGGRLTPQLLATLSFVLGVMLVFSSVTPTPDQNLEFLASYVPLPLVEGAHFLASIMGLGLLVGARGLGQRMDGAWWVALIGSILALALSLLKGIALVEAGFLLFFIGALLATRRFFTRHASLFKQAMTTSWLLAIAVVCIGAVVILFFVYRDIDYSHDLWWQFEFFSEAPRSLRAALGVTILAVFLAIFSLLRPAVSHLESLSNEALAQAVAIVETQDNADANLVRMGDKSVMFSEKADAFIMYAKQGRSWIALFDPVGNRYAFPELVWRFVESARSAGCRAVFYQISPELLPSCADAGLRAYKLGELAVTDLRNFEMKGGKWANLRQAASRAQRDGLSFEVVEPHNVAAIMDDLSSVSRAWLAHHKAREKGFSLGAFDPDYLKTQAIGLLKKDNQIVAFANILVTNTKDEGTIDLMRFSPDAPKGAMDFLFVQIMEYLKSQGFAHFNLGMAPLSGMSKRDIAPAWDRIGATVFEHGERFYNFKGLRAFKAKFHPHWQSRYLAISGGSSPMIALMDAALLIGGGFKGVIGK